MTIKEWAELYKPPGWEPRPTWKFTPKSALQEASGSWYWRKLDEAKKVVCECGAKFTSEPKLHLQWCPLNGLAYE